MGGKAVIGAIAVIALVLPSARADEYQCTAADSKPKCDHTLKKGDKLVLDCTGATTQKIPTTLLESNGTAAKVCVETAKRTKYDATCTDKTFESLKSKNLKFTPKAGGTGLTIENTDYKEESDMILSGVCTSGLDSNGAPTGTAALFNVTLKKVDKSSALGTRLGLATATGIALVGLAAF